MVRKISDKERMDALADALIGLMEWHAWGLHVAPTTHRYFMDWSGKLRKLFKESDEWTKKIRLRK